MNARAQEKRVATVTARAALLGCELCQLPGGYFILAGAPGQRRFGSLQAAESRVLATESVADEARALGKGTGAQREQ